METDGIEEVSDIETAILESINIISRIHVGPDDRDVDRIDGNPDAHAHARHTPPDEQRPEAAGEGEEVEREDKDVELFDVLVPAGRLALLEALPRISEELSAVLVKAKDQQLLLKGGDAAPAKALLE